MTKNGAVQSATETISQKAPRIVEQVGEITRPMALKLGVKLGLVSEKKSFIRQPRFYEPAILLILAIYGMIRSFKRDKNN